MNGTISPNRIITFDELETMYNICAGDVADTPAATPYVTDVPGPVIAPMRPIGVEEMARTFNISNEPVTDVPASTPNAGAGLSRVPLVAPVPDYPRIPAPLLEHTKEMGIINALSSAASYLEHMAGIEEETAHSEGWNFDASVELISLSRRLGRIPFGGPTEKLYDIRPSQSSKGKKRETFEAPDESGKRTIFNLDPKHFTDAWLGKNPLQVLASRDPLSRMDPTPTKESLDDWIMDEFPDLFGPGADHECHYRERLLGLLKRVSQDASTENVASKSILSLLVDISKSK
jgi:hypothetical protein